MRVHLIIIIIIIIGFIIIAAAAAAAGRARLVYSCTALLVWRDTTAAITGQSTPRRASQLPLTRRPIDNNNDTAAAAAAAAYYFRGG